MSRFTPVLIHAASSARPVGKMSQQKAFAPEGGRGRKLAARRRVQGALGHGLPDEAGFRDFWAGLLKRRCGCAAAVAQVFGCTEQTGRNWLSGQARPIGDAVWHAMGLWPADFGMAARAA
jgi:hypothetical protein